MDKLDFRSDTVTWPTLAMREAMATAGVGDDVYGEDPTVNELEALAAAKVGMEAGLFVASGTMGNIAAILAHTTRGDEAIVGADAHTFCWEAGGMAVLGGVTPRPLPTDRYGRMDVAQIEAAVRDDNPHLPHTRLILLENSYGGKYGYPLSPDYFADVRVVADRHGLATHMDGARLFNAAAALKRPVAELVQDVDSVTFCLSKGLCAPVGSVLCGTADFIHQARRARKVLGGGMRQAGVLAAAGLVALREMVDRLPQDHAHACRLAQGLAAVPNIDVDVEMVHTNMVFFDLNDALPLSSTQFVAELRARANIWINGSDSRRFRAVTHYWIDETAVDLFVETAVDIVTA